MEREPSPDALERAGSHTRFKKRRSRWLTWRIWPRQRLPVTRRSSSTVVPLRTRRCGTSLTSEKQLVGGRQRVMISRGFGEDTSRQSRDAGAGEPERQVGRCVTTARTTRRGAHRRRVVTRTGEQCFSDRSSLKQRALAGVCTCRAGIWSSVQVHGPRPDDLSSVVHGDVHRQCEAVEPDEAPPKRDLLELGRTRRRQGNFSPGGSSRGNLLEPSSSSRGKLRCRSLQPLSLTRGGPAPYGKTQSSTKGGEVVPQTGLDLRAGVSTTAAPGYQHRRERDRSGG